MGRPRVTTSDIMPRMLIMDGNKSDPWRLVTMTFLQVTENMDSGLAAGPAIFIEWVFAADINRRVSTLTITFLRSRLARNLIKEI
jgi:hypothetical protein